MENSNDLTDPTKNSPSTPIGATSQAEPEDEEFVKQFYPPPPKGPLSTIYALKLFAAKEASNNGEKKKYLASKTALDLLELVQNELVHMPFSHEGKLWTARSMEWYATNLGMSERQVRRIIEKVPLIRNRALKEGKVTSLLRLGDPDEKTPEDLARMMSSQFRKRLERRPNRRDFGCLVHFAKETFPYSVDIFCTILDDWGGFMSAARFAISRGQAGDDPYSKDQNAFYERYYRYAVISLIRRFNYAAIDYYYMRLQEEASNNFGNAKELLNCGLKHPLPEGWLRLRYQM